MAYRLSGRSGLPLVLVLGGLNSNRAIEQWWPEQLGPKGPLDSRRYRLLSVDWACPQGRPERTLLTQDHAQALEVLLKRHDIARLHLLCGASYGAMVALALAERGQLAIRRLLTISGAHYSHPVATAARYLQREVVRLGAMAGFPTAGLNIARGLAMNSYRTRELFSERFPQADAAERLDSIQSYLSHVGNDFAARFSVERFLDLSESLDLHQVNPQGIDCPATVVAVDSDQLVPLSQMQALAGSLAGPTDFHCLQSPYGHDAFLKAHQAIAHVLNQCLEEKQHATA
nr:alpha/beta fold hydrolase [Natronospira proteinivora]